MSTPAYRSDLPAARRRRTKIALAVVLLAIGTLVAFALFSAFTGYQPVADVLHIGLIIALCISATDLTWQLLFDSPGTLSADSEGIQLVTDDETIFLPYTDIDEIRCFVIPLFIGHIRITSPTETIAVPIHRDRLDRFLKMLLSGVKDAGREDTYHPGEIERFFGLAYLTSRTRKTIVKLLLAGIPPGLLVAGFFAFAPPDLNSWFLILSAWLLPTIGWLLATWWSLSANRQQLDPAEQSFLDLRQLSNPRYLVFGWVVTIAGITIVYAALLPPG